MLRQCPRCGIWHDDGVLIQKEGDDKAVYLCHECGDEILEEKPNSRNARDLRATQE